MAAPQGVRPGGEWETRKSRREGRPLVQSYRVRAVSIGFITVFYEAIQETSSAYTRIAIDT